MTTTIRHFSPDDYTMICSWWKDAGEVPPSLSHMPEESSFVLEFEDSPILAVTLFLTNGPMAWIDNLIGNPNYKNAERKNQVSVLLHFLNDFAKERGKQSLFCMSAKKSTSRRYEQLGFHKTMTSIETFIKEIK